MLQVAPVVGQEVVHHHPHHLDHRAAVVGPLGVPHRALVAVQTRITCTETSEEHRTRVPHRDNKMVGILTLRLGFMGNIASKD